MDDFLNDLVLIPRVQWNAKEAKSEEDNEKPPIPYMVVYHDHKTRCHNRNECTRMISEMQKNHMAKGESDILYHYVITMDGIVYEGRSTKSVGRRFPYSEKEYEVSNNKSITIGCLDNGEKNIPVPVVKSLIALTEKLRRDGLIDLDVQLKIYFPEDHPNKVKDSKEDKEEMP